MSRFNQAPANGKLSDLYSRICDAGFGANGTPINWFTSMSSHPALMESSWGLVHGVLVEEGKLPATLKQMVLMTISLQNQCRYCAATHTGVLEAMGVPEDVIMGCAKDPSTAKIPPPHREIIQFALKAARDPNSVAEEDLNRLRDVGMGDAEIVEAGMLAAFTNFINTWADLSGVEVDAPAKTDTWGTVASSA